MSPKSLVPMKGGFGAPKISRQSVRKGSNHVDPRAGLKVRF